MHHVQIYLFSKLISSTNNVDSISPLNLLNFNPTLMQLLHPSIISDWLPTSKVKHSDWLDKSFPPTVI